MAEKGDLGQIWTPQWVIDLILDEIGFTVDNGSILSSKVLEPSFGEGIFLQNLITRLIAATKKIKSDQKIGPLIDSLVYGVEYDSDLFIRTKKNLRDWCKATHNIEITLPNLTMGDALEYKNFNFFDYVVGNPPYVRIHNLPLEMRKKVKEYSLSAGTTDLYIIFYELGLRWIKDTGRLGYIAPNSWMKNASQKKFRQEIVDKRAVKKIIDFGSFEVFPQVGTYTSITIMQRESTKKHLSYVSMKDASQINFNILIEYDFLKKKPDAPFNFVSEKDYEILSRHQSDAKSLGDVCKVQNGLATLGDRYFLYESSKDSQFLLPVVKASVYKGEKITKKIIFPYEKNDQGKYVGVTEKKLAEENSELHQHLLYHKKKLTERSIDKNTEWFWYGRTQAIQETEKEKLVFSHIISPGQSCIKAFILPANTLVYSGLFITEVAGGKSLKALKKIIESEEFTHYCRMVGKDMSGGYKSFGTPAVKKFKLT